MANRNVSQLPENTDPQDTDWILGASGNSPSVLQKIAIGNLPSSTPSNGGGSIKFSLPVNENKVLDSSGYYFTDNIAADITIDCSNLGIGDHIIWHNLSTKAVFFSGLNSIDGVLIPANKGLMLPGGDFIEFFLKDSSKNIKKRSGVHIIDWLPGFSPPGFTWWRIDFTMILSEIQFYYDEAPDTRVQLSGGNVISFERSATYSTGALQYNQGALNNGNFGQSGNEYIGTISSGFNTWIVNLPSEKKVVALHLGGQSSGNNRPTLIRLYSGVSSSTWNLEKEWTGNPISIADNTGSKFLV